MADAAIAAENQPEKLKQFYYLNGSRSQKLIEQRLQLIQKAVPLTDELAVLESHTLRVQLLCRELQLLQKAIAQFDERIAEVFQSHEDRHIFESFPGAGPVLAPRLLASLDSERDRFARASNLQSFSGIAPVTKQSGGKCHIHRRYLCPTFFKQSFHEYAKESVLWSRWATAFYLQQRQKGCGHLFTELGPDFVTRFATAKHFGSWLGLCPDNRITGGKILSSVSVTPSAT